jgi:CRISPR-associated protein Csd1
MKDTPEDTHPAIHLDNAQPSGASLLSSNADSFLSYGEQKIHIRGVGKYAAFAYTTALGELLIKGYIEKVIEQKDDNTGKVKSKKVNIDESKHHKTLGSDTIVYWAEGDDEKESEIFSMFADPRESDSDKLSALIGYAARGLYNEYDKIADMSKTFYILCLSPNAGRISVRFFYRDTFGSIVEKIAEHYNNLDIIGKSEKFPYLPPWIILSETTVKKSAQDAAPLLSGQLLNSIVTGDDYPLTLYNAILIRIRAGDDVNSTKAAIIKAVLKRNKIFESEVATVALNKDSTNIPYTLGRLFSVLENLQENAGNKGVRERYFSSACSNPNTVFPSLLRLSMHHADKAEYGRSFEFQKTDLIGRLNSETPFPSALSLQEQGEFIVGYYHQVQARYTKKSNAREESNNG